MYGGIDVNINWSLITILKRVLFLKLLGRSNEIFSVHPKSFLASCHLRRIFKLVLGVKVLHVVYLFFVRLVIFRLVFK